MHEWIQPNSIKHLFIYKQLNAAVEKDYKVSHNTQIYIIHTSLLVEITAFYDINLII